MAKCTFSMCRLNKRQVTLPSELEGLLVSDLIEAGTRCWRLQDIEALLAPISVAMI